MELDKSFFKNLMETGSFIHQYIKSDLGEHTERIKTRFPPEPNGYLHIGNMKAVFINYGFSKIYGGTFNLRMDDTNPVKEDTEYVEAIKNDIKWMGFDWEDRFFYASDYFDICYEGALKLIQKGKAFVCDLSADELRESRGTLTTPGTDSPYRNRSIQENMDLFLRMKNGEFPDGTRTLRAKIDMKSPNINLRDPVIYRIAHVTHHNTGDKWCIYPMYDYAHPIQDAVEGITHSMCSLEFEDHRPLYNWVVDELEFMNKPRQIEFTKIQVSNTVMGKRYLRKLVETGQVDGWDDPRMVTIIGMRRRGYPPEAIVDFLDLTGVSKGVNKIEFANLEHCVRENLKARVPVKMAVLNPLKVVITNYPADKTELVEIENNPENPELGTRHVPFSREIFVERDDYLENAPAKFYRLSEGREVRLKGAYFITCNEAVKDSDGNVIELRCTYDPETKSGSGFNARKVKGTIHWVNAADAVPIKAMLYDVLVYDDPDSEEGVRMNPDSLIIRENAVAEPSVKGAVTGDRFQFIRNGYFCVDKHAEDKGRMVFNRIVSLKSSYKE